MTETSGWHHRWASCGQQVTRTSSLAKADFSRAIGLTSLAIGAASGLVLGLWSFDGPVLAPDWAANYGDLPRRLVRLGHIAWFGLGILNLILARQLPDLPLGARSLAVALGAMNLGNLLLPPLPVAAAFLPTLKYLLPVPALAVFTALALRARRLAQLAGTARPV